MLQGYVGFPLEHSMHVNQGSCSESRGTAWFQAFATSNYCRKSGSARNRPQLGLGKPLVDTSLGKN